MAGHTHFEEHTEEYLEAVYRLERDGPLKLPLGERVLLRAEVRAAQVVVLPGRARRPRNDYPRGRHHSQGFPVQLPFLIEDREPAQMVDQHQLDGVARARLRRDRDDRSRHHIGCLHDHL